MLGMLCQLAGEGTDTAAIAMLQLVLADRGMVVQVRWYVSPIASWHQGHPFLLPDTSTMLSKDPSLRCDVMLPPHMACT